jgi:hypothetical protein
MSNTVHNIATIFNVLFKNLLVQVLPYSPLECLRWRFQEHLILRAFASGGFNE